MTAPNIPLSTIQGWDLVELEAGRLALLLQIEGRAPLAFAIDLTKLSLAHDELDRIERMLRS